MTSKPGVPEAPVIAFRDAAELAAWLDTHLGQQAGVWLKLAKKGSGIPSLTSDEAVDIGLCYGWISGQRQPLDDVHYLQKYVPRRPRSRWSQVNVGKVAALTAAGLMRPSGLAEVETARKDGPGRRPTCRSARPAFHRISPPSWHRVRERHAHSNASTRRSSTR